MPFQSEKQRRYLWANEPEIARDWADTYGSRIKKDDGGIMRVGMYPGGVPGGGDKGMKGKGDSFGDSYGPGRNVAGPVKGAIDEFKAPAHIQRELKALARNLAEDKREEKVERFRNKKTLNKKTREFFLDKVLNAGKYKGLTAEQFAALGLSEQEDKYGDYLDARGLGTIDAYGNYIGGGGGGDGSYYPRDVHPGTGVTEGAEVEDTPSAFQQSLTGTADTPNYYVGENPLASNIAWGKKFGADPRTMGMTSFAANGGRIPRAFGGIMDSSTGRRAYGFGSVFKSIKKAAGKVLKSPIGKAALIAGAGWAANTWGPTAGWFGNMTGNIAGSDIGKKLFMKNIAEKGAVANWVPSWGKLGIWGASALPWLLPGPEDDEGDKGADYDLLKNKYAQELMNIKSGLSAGSLNPEQWSYLPSNYTYTGAEGGRAGYYAGGQSTPSDYTMEDAMMTTTQDKLGGITDVMKQADLYRQGSVGQMYAADGGRIGFAGGMNEKLAELKKAYDTYTKGGGTLSFDKFSAAFAEENFAQGGRIGYDAGGQTGHPPITTGQISQAPPQAPAPQAPPMPAPQPNRMAGMHPMMRGMNPMMGGRRMAQEGGLMDLGGMEKDYRQEGGFVPLGGEEKADDVPARLSKNEFVFTADAVRGAGDGDIDKGAEIMENIMKNLEQGGQISEETQGLTGAQEMFGVSERLSEVV